MYRTSEVVMGGGGFQQGYFRFWDLGGSSPPNCRVFIGGGDSPLL